MQISNRPGRKIQKNKFILKHQEWRKKVSQNKIKFILMFEFFSQLFIGYFPLNIKIEDKIHQYKCKNW